MQTYTPATTQPIRRHAKLKNIDGRERSVSESRVMATEAFLTIAGILAIAAVTVSLVWFAFWRA